LKPLGVAKCIGCGEEVSFSDLDYPRANVALGEIGWRVVRFEKGWGLACVGCIPKGMVEPLVSP
jgi:hypothetical protein